MTLTDIIENEYNRYSDRRVDPTLPDWSIQMAEATLARLDGELEVALGNRSHEDYTLAHIEKQQAKIGEREAPLCTCDLASCPLKNDELPRTVREAETLQEGIATFRQEHSGTPLVLIEAREEYGKALERARHHVSIAEAILGLSANPDDPDPADMPLPRGVDEPEELLA